jgi:hypothetical protein
MGEFRSWMELYQDMSFIEDGLREDLRDTWINFLEIVRDQPDVACAAARDFLLPSIVPDVDTKVRDQVPAELDDVLSRGGSS